MYLYLGILYKMLYPPPQKKKKKHEKTRFFDPRSGYILRNVARSLTKILIFLIS
jgi:hypothetical protein